MPAQQTKIPQLPDVSANVTADSFVVCVVPENPSASPAVFSVSGLVPIDSLPLSFANTPANSTSTSVSSGRVWTDGTYLYVATANNVVKRASLSTF